jgi:hypothetical protein
MTKDSQINAIRYAIDTIELWMTRYPKRVDEDDFKAIEQLQELIDFMESQK